MHELDTLQTYLLAINAASLCVGFADWRASRRGRGITPFVSIAFSLLGGAPAMLITSFAAHGHTRKDNVAQRFFAAWSLIAWVLVLANVYGWHRFDCARLVESLGRSHLPLWIFLGVMNALTFVLFCVDKGRAKRDAWRIGEGVLLGFSLFGGALGGLLGMLLAHHKVRTPYFRIGLPLALLLDLAVIAYLLQAGLV